MIISLNYVLENPFTQFLLTVGQIPESIYYSFLNETCQVIEIWDLKLDMHELLPYYLLSFHLMVWLLWELVGWNSSFSGALNWSNLGEICECHQGFVGWFRFINNAIAA